MLTIRFRLLWMKKGTALRRGFKSDAACSLFQEYMERISHFTPAQGEGGPPELKPRSLVWLCDRQAGSRALSSEDLAGRLDAVLQSGAAELQVVIGRADGFTAEERRAWKPDVVWSFGPMTLPHELAAVVAAEQLYRAWSILKNHPYHQGH